MLRPLIVLFLAACLGACLGATASETGNETFHDTLTQSLTVKSKPWTLSPENLASRIASAPEGKVWDLREWDQVSLTAQRTDKTLGGLRLRWIVTSRIGGAYQSIQASVVSNAAPATLTAAFSPASAALIPAGHQRPWDSLAASQVVSIELRPECIFSTAGNDPITLTATKPVLKKAAAAEAATLTDVQLFAAPHGYNAEAELRFRIHPLPADPFAVEGAGDVRVALKAEKPLLAFVDQNFSFVAEGAHFRAVPNGEPFFRAFLPTLPASGSISISNGKQTWTLPISALRTGQQPARPPTEFLSTPWKPALTATLPETPSHGLPIYPSELFSNGRFQITLKNTPTTPCWRPIPFWTSAWSAFHGGALPSLELAARMDAELAQAAAKGDARPLIALDGATLERSGPFNWSSHPLKNTLKGPTEFFSHEEGTHFAKRWTRYCLARWGRSKAVSEYWLTLDTLAPGDAAFFKTLAASLQGWTESAPARLYARHPFAAESKAASTIATFDGRESAVWFADARQGASLGGRTTEGTDGQHGFGIRARNPSELTIGLTADFSRLKEHWGQPLADNLSGGDTLVFDVEVGEETPPDLRIGVHVRDRDGLWFQTLLPEMPQPGAWTTYALDLSARNSHGLKASGHSKMWTEYSRQRLSEIGLHLYSVHKDWTPDPGGQPVPLRAVFDHIRLVQRPAPQLDAPAIALVKKFLFKSGTVEPAELASAQVGDLFKCDFSVNRTFENPFDPTSCDLAAVIETPSGKTVRVPLFFNQPCVRSEAKPGGDEVVSPVGAELFSLRYRIVEAGPHRVSIEWREGGRYDSKREWFSDRRYTPDGEAQVALGRGRGGLSRYAEYYENGKRPVDTVKFVPGKVIASLDLGKAAFTASAPDKPFRGFVRTAADRRHLQFDDGSFYYALGPCARSPSDRRIAYNSDKFDQDEIDRLGRRGTYQYDDYFAEYEKAGINWARVWMCSWWGSLEWRRDWPGFQGLGRYNLLNAWRIDHMLAEAERRGVYISLCLTNHGQFSLYVDAEWENNPYNARLGGPLIAATEFFSAREAKILHQNKLRYVLARYGHSPNIATFALFSEAEWTEEYEPNMRGWGGEDAAAPVMDQWHTEMAEFLRENDPNKHLTLTHFSMPKNGGSTLALPAIDVAASNAYSAFPDFGPGRFDAGFALASYWAGYPDGELKGFERFGKPVLVEEQGRHWMGGRNNTLKELDADLHAQLWGGVVQPMAGATGYWWWVQLHLDNRYGKFAALSRFIKNEDFRPAKGETLLEPAYRNIPAKDGQLYGRALKSNRRLYAWIFHPNVPRGGDSAPVSGGEVRLGGMDGGVYTLEIWNTYSGTLTESRDVTIPVKDGKPESITITLPVVDRDLAIKLKPKK